MPVSVCIYQLNYIIISLAYTFSIIKDLCYYLTLLTLLLVDTIYPAYLYFFTREAYQYFPHIKLMEKWCMPSFESVTDKVKKNCNHVFIFSIVYISTIIFMKYLKLLYQEAFVYLKPHCNYLFFKKHYCMLDIHMIFNICLSDLYLYSIDVRICTKNFITSTCVIHNYRSLCVHACHVK